MRNILMGLVGVLMFSSIFSQSLLDPIDVQVIIEPTSELIIANNVADTLTDILDLMSDSEPMAVKLSLNVQDTLNVTAISVKIGRALVTSDVIEHTFAFDNNAPGGNYSYDREGMIVTLGMGNHSNVETLFYEIYFEGANAATSQTITGSTE